LLIFKLGIQGAKEEERERMKLFLNMFLTSVITIIVSSSLIEKQLGKKEHMLPRRIVGC
jgi:hypothetical protein